MRLRYLPLFLAMFGTASLSAADFESCFSDSTLRIDYIFGGNAAKAEVMLDRMSKFPGWAGRRHHLNQLPYTGNGTVSVILEATGDTIYRSSFSTLYQEWLSTDEAQTSTMAFENSFLVPLPKNPVEIEVKLLDNRHQQIAKLNHKYDPKDILVRQLTGEVLPHRYLHRGIASNPIDVAILAEGYRVEEMDSFYHYAQVAVDEILSYEPFKSNSAKFNFVAVASPSVDSGVSIPRLNEWKSTAFSSHFSTFYSDRYLTTRNVYDIHDALKGIPYEHIIILANTPEYGGGGIYNSYMLTSSIHKSFKPVVVHEFGHSFAGLGDEYFYESDALDGTYSLEVEPWEPNITTLIDFGSKWEKMLQKNTPIPTPVEQSKKYPVGVYEGGGYRTKGIYRPADECRMRNNTYPVFCPVCHEAIARVINFYTD